MDVTRVRWGSDRAGQAQVASGVNAVLFPAAILLPPALFLSLGVATAVGFVRRHGDRPTWLGNACMRAAEMSAAAITFDLLAGGLGLDPASARSVLAVAAAAAAMVAVETVLVVHLTRAWDGLDAHDLPLWSSADLLAEVPEMLVGGLFCLLYPTPAALFVIGLMAWSHFSIREHAGMRAASRDDKTGLLNLPAFEDLATAELDRARRTGAPVAVLLMDLDGLKKVNTDHGHLAGDQYIVTMARLLADASRSYDLVARFGGDEFCVLLPDTPMPDAIAIAERIRSSTARTRIPGLTAPMAVSIGVASAAPADDIRSLLATADTALRYAKAHDRNQVVVAQDEVESRGTGHHSTHSLHVSTSTVEGDVNPR
jgi:diguanylate cyclase (GGDEF)-like protein